MCSRGSSRRLRPPCHDPEDWPCEGPPWLWPTEEPDCEEPDEDEPEDPDEEEPLDDEEPEESVPLDEESLPFDESSDEEPDDVVPDVDDPVVFDEPEVVDPVDCVPEKSTADVMPAAARLDSPTIDVTQTAARFPADRESMISTSVSSDSLRV